MFRPPNIKFSIQAYIQTIYVLNMTYKQYLKLANYSKVLINHNQQKLKAKSKRKRKRDANTR